MKKEKNNPIWLDIKVSDRCGKITELRHAPYDLALATLDSFIKKKIRGI